MAIYKRAEHPHGYNTEKANEASQTESPETNPDTLGSVEISPQQTELVLNVARGIIDLKHSHELEGVHQPDYIFDNLRYALAALPEDQREHSYASRLMKLMAGSSLHEPVLRLIDEARVSAGQNAAGAIEDAWTVINRRHDSIVQRGATLDSMIAAAPDSETKASLMALSAGSLSDGDPRISQSYIDMLEAELRSKE